MKSIIRESFAAVYIQALYKINKKYKTYSCLAICYLEYVKICLNNIAKRLLFVEKKKGRPTMKSQ